MIALPPAPRRRLLLHHRLVSRAQLASHPFCSVTPSSSLPHSAVTTRPLRCGCGVDSADRSSVPQHSAPSSHRQEKQCTGDVRVIWSSRKKLKMGIRWATGATTQGVSRTTSRVARCGGPAESSDPGSRIYGSADPQGGSSGNRISPELKCPFLDFLKIRNHIGAAPVRGPRGGLHEHRERGALTSVSYRNLLPTRAGVPNEAGRRTHDSSHVTHVTALDYVVSAEG